MTTTPIVNNTPIVGVIFVVILSMLAGVGLLHLATITGFLGSIVPGG